jgi:hypothetical protein
MLEDILVPLGVFAMIAYIAKVIGDTRIRRKALESHADPNVKNAVLDQGWSAPSTLSALKWGLIIVALGLGILIVDLFAIGFESPLAYGILFLSTGTALLGYYLIEKDAGEPEQHVRPDPTTASSTTERASSEDVPDPEL